MDVQRATRSPIPQPQPVHHPTSQPDHGQPPTPGSGNSGVGAGHDLRAQTPSPERHLLGHHPEGYHTLSTSHDNPYTDFERLPAPRPARSREGQVRLSSRHPTLASPSGLPPVPSNGSGIDWIVPVDEKEKSGTRRTVGERLQPTIDHAVAERDKYAKKALWTGYALNIAIGLQVLFGALTTGIAAAVTSGRQSQVSTATLGGMSTLVASYLARARGSGEPELSITRTKDLEQFLRECKAFQMDHAHEYSTPGSGLDERLDDLRRRFEELLGNANGERKLSPVGITSTHAAP